jgi:hypothetical protein
MSVPIQQHEIERSGEEDRRSRLVAGIALLAIGALALLTEVGTGLPLGRYFLLLLGGIFLTWAIVVRSAGLLIPGGILAGLGLGVFLVSGPLDALGSNQTGAAMLFSFALGWLLMVPLSALLGEFMAWPLIPGGILAAVAGALWIGGSALEVLSWIGKAWPLGLVALGLYFLLTRDR